MKKILMSAFFIVMPFLTINAVPCDVHQITITINGDSQGTVKCGDTFYRIPCCSDFGNDVGWCR